MLTFNTLVKRGKRKNVHLIAGFLVATLFVALSAIPANASNVVATGPDAGGTTVTLDGIEFVQISSRSGHSLGLTSEGTVYAWGYNASGQLGDNTTNNSSTPVQVVGVGGVGYLSGITQVDAGGWHSLARAVDGTVYAWGQGIYGALGGGALANSSTPVHVVGVGGTGILGDIVEVNSGAFHTLARTSSGTVYAWGFNGQGQLGNGLVNSVTHTSSPVQVLDSTGNNPLTGITQLAAGYHNSLVLTNTGTVLSWGRNLSGELGNGTNTSSPLPVLVAGVGGSGTLTGVTQIAAGWYFSLALTNSGNVYAWGANNYGELGSGATGNGMPGTAADTNAPIQVLGVGGVGFLSDVTQITAGDGHSVALTAGGVFAWGANSEGQLGDGTTTHSATPVQVLGLGGVGVLGGVTQIIAGWSHNTALDTNGAIYSWGANDVGQFGDGTNTFSNEPVLGPNFQFDSVSFGAQPATVVSRSNNTWSVLSPAGTPGTVNIVGHASLFGGAIPAATPTVTWSIGTFTYTSANNGGSGSSSGGLLAKTGTETVLPLSIGAVLVLGAGIVLTVARRRKLMP